MKTLKNLAIVFPLALAATAMFAQTTAVPTSKKPTVFLSNDGGINNADMQRAYTSVASALREKDKMELVNSPSSASIFISIKCESRTTHENDITVYNHLVKLSVIDPASHQTLWSVEERGPYPPVHFGGDAWGKSFTKVAEKLAADLQQAENSGNVAFHQIS